MDNSAILEEKLALSRETAILKPEMDHLRAQVASNQNLLAEKLSLQRELSAIQVELEIERRAIQRKALEEDGRHTREADQELQLQQLQSNLNTERKERQKVERELHRIASELDAKKSVYEARLDGLRNKLRITKDQLKQAQVELRNSDPMGYLRRPSASIDDKASAMSRKRSIAQVDADSAIGTPGNPPAEKRAKRGSALPGEKSTFSITPYLNRTATIVQESLLEIHSNLAIEESHDHEDSQLGYREGGVTEKDQDRTSSSKHVEEAVDEAIRPSPRPKQSKALVSVPTANTNAKAPARRKGKVVTTLGQVREEDFENHMTTSPQTGKKNTTGKTCDHPEAVENSELVAPNAVKKKRRLLGGSLGKTLLDDDNIDMRNALNGTKLLGLDRANAKLGKAGLGCPPSTGLLGGTGTFSPLKRDKKAT